MAEQIYQLIGKAMQEVGAIGKDSVNQTQGFKYRGIDAVYNALNPVMSKLGLFVCPEIIDHRREERESEKVYNNKTTKTLLKYSILTIKYTIYAPDGSSVSCTVVGEGMDSGDKASNKAMSVAMKYAMFQLLMIPTEEMVDPDSESHNVTSGAKEPDAPKETQQENLRKDAPADVKKVNRIPDAKQTPPPPADPVPPVLEYLAREREGLRIARQVSKAENNALWKAQIAALTEAKLIPAKPLTEFTQEEAENLIDAMYKCFEVKGTKLNEGVIA